MSDNEPPKVVPEKTQKTSIADLGKRIEALETDKTDDNEHIRAKTAHINFIKTAQKWVIITTLTFEAAIVASFLYKILFDPVSFKYLGTGGIIALISGFFVSLVGVTGFILLGLFPRDRKDTELKMPVWTKPVIDAIKDK